MAYITARSGAQFDPEVVQALLDVIERDHALGQQTSAPAEGN
jgi:HD-GYP domain-containing protein (c-di-GMP phosphodiesterase class II)